MTLHSHTIKSKDLSEIQSYLNGPKYFSCLYEIKCEFRRKSKYLNEATTWEDAYELLVSLLNGHDIDPFNEP